MNVETGDWGRAIPFLGIHKWDFRRSVVGARRLTCRSSRLFHLYSECSGYPLARTLATQGYVGLHLINKKELCYVYKTKQRYKKFTSKAS